MWGRQREKLSSKLQAFGVNIDFVKKALYYRLFETLAISSRFMFISKVCFHNQP